MKNSINRSKGFTITEIVCVIGVILLLMSLIFPSSKLIREKALLLQSKTQFLKYIDALEDYYDANGAFPSDLANDNKATPLDSNFVKILADADCEIAENEIHAGKIVDAFFNSNLRIIFKKNNEQTIEKELFPAEVQAFIKNIEGLRANIAIFSIPTEGKPCTRSW